MKKISRTCGFTILETVIYVALFSVLMTGVLETVFGLFASDAQNQKMIAIQEEGTFVQRKLHWALTGATAVSVPNAKTLRISRPDLGAESPLTVQEDGGYMSMARGSGMFVPLTTSEYVVTDTDVVYTPATPDLPPSIRIRYQIGGVPFEYKTYLHI